MNWQDIFVYSSCILIDEEMWYISDFENMLLKTNINTGITECVGVIPGSNGVMHAYRNLIHYKRWIFLIPFRGGDIVKYDMTSKIFENILLPDKLHSILGNKSDLFGGFVYQDSLILYSGYGVVIKYDFLGEDFKYINLKERFSIIDESKWFWRNGFVIKNSLYLPLLKHNAYILVNLENEECNLIELEIVDGKAQYIISLKYNNRVCHITIDCNWNADIIIFDSLEKQKVYKQFRVYYDSESNIQGETPFYWGGIVENELILLPGYSNDICTINLEK